MTRKKRRLVALVLAWVGVLYIFLTWQVREARRRALERAEAIAMQQRQVATFSTSYDTAAEKEVDEVDKPPYLGEFKVTVYTPECDGGRWGYQTATGEVSEHLMTCAVDPAVIELGSVLYVGELQLVAADTGSAVSGNVVDVFFDGTPEEARAWLAGFGDSAQVWLCQ